MNTTFVIQTWVERLQDFMTQSLNTLPSAKGEEMFNSLALECFALQTSHNPVLKRWVERRALPAISHWTQIPALPVAAFKEFDVSCIPQEERTAEFHSSGTTGAKTSRHFHHPESLALYESSLRPWFQRHLAPDASLPRPLFLTPPPQQAPHSSLVHMFETIRQHTPSDHARFAGTVDQSMGGWQLDLSRVAAFFESSLKANQPITILGTAFNFVQLLDELVAQDLRYELPPGSRIMETGGYKGRTRAIPKQELHAWITEQLGVPPDHIVCEYGMSELSSQAYDRMAQSDAGATRSFRFPPWARARIVSPETGQEVAVGETGLIQVYDLANAWSVLALQTEDLGIRAEQGFALVGRVAQAEPKGCSLQALSR